MLPRPASRLPLCVDGTRTDGWAVDATDVVAVLHRGLTKYTGPISYRQEGEAVRAVLNLDDHFRADSAVSGRGTSCTSRPTRTSTGRCGRCARRSACSPAVPGRGAPRRAAGPRTVRGRAVAEPLLDVADAGGSRTSRPHRPAVAAEAARAAVPARAARRRPGVAPARAPVRAATPAAIAAAPSGSPPTGRGGLLLDGHAEDRRGDLVADEAAQLLVQPERLARNSLSGSCWA